MYYNPYYNRDQAYQTSRLSRRSYASHTYPYDADNEYDATLWPSAPAHNKMPTKPTPTRAGLSIIVLTKDKPEFICPLLRQLVSAKLSLSNCPVEIIVGDTGSTDDHVLCMYRELSPHITVELGMRYHFSSNNNQLFNCHSSMNTLCFLNNDITFDNPEATLTSMLHLLTAHPEIGILGSYLFYPNGLAQHAGVEIATTGVNRSKCEHIGVRTNLPRPAYNSIFTVPAVTGALLFVRATVFSTLGGFDERYQRECQDADLCLAAWRVGRKVAVAYVGDVTHVEGGTRSTVDDQPSDRRLFSKKWSAFVEAADFT